MKQEPRPPRLFQRFFRWFCHSSFYEELNGDLLEHFYENLDTKGLRFAKKAYIKDVLALFRPSVIKQLNIPYLSTGILFNHLKVASRTLFKNKSFALLNIGGLAIGMTAAILIGLWIKDELSYNKSFKNYEYIASVAQSATDNSTGIRYTGIGSVNPIPLANELQASFGEHFTHIVRATDLIDYSIIGNDKKFRQKGMHMDDKAPHMLSMKMLSGSKDGLKDKQSILLSESLAKKIYGENDPVSKSLQLESSVVTIRGVYEDFPNNSEFRELEFIAPMELYVSLNPWVREQQNNWNDGTLRVYVQIASNTTFDQISAKIKNIGQEHLAEPWASRKRITFLHPMSKWHLYSAFDEKGQTMVSGPLRYVRFYALIGFFVLMLACINFMNLSTARSTNRAKEVGIRKTIGSLRFQIAGQFMVESMLVSILAFLSALLIVQILLPWFNAVADKDIFIVWTDFSFWFAGISFTLFTALLAGSYPSFYLSALKPIRVLKGQFKAGPSAKISRQILVVFQFTISIALIIGTAVIYKQIEHSKNRPLGYQQQGLLNIFIPYAHRGKEALLKNELLNSGAVSEVAFSASSPNFLRQTNPFFTWKGKDPNLQKDFGFMAISPDYGKTIGWKMLSGRDFLANHSSDSSAVIINKAAANIMGIENPVGETITWERRNRDPKHFTILGISDNMVMRSPFDPTIPTVFFLRGSKPWVILKANPNLAISEGIAKAEIVFDKLFPSLPFEYSFIDEAHAAKFEQEERLGSIAGFFSLLAIIISLLGLFGLAAFMAEQRTKEIGIRKVLGASIRNIWQLLSKDFIRLTLISCMIATPVAYYFLNMWLQNYDYRTEISWWLLIGVCLGVLSITLFTISFQAIKAALANPVQSIKLE